MAEPSFRDPYCRPVAGVTITILGEAMLELHAQAGRTCGIPYGGDTLNTAVHLARLGHRVAYVTAVGMDPVSDALVAAWRAEGIDTSLVLRHPDRQPGIYAIHVDAAGERSFLYWRDQSAARAMFDLDGMASALETMVQSQLFYFSHVSLAILPAEARERLLAVAAAVRSRGGSVAYDSNYRPRLWDSRDTARHWSQRAMALASIGLPTTDDERAMCASDCSDTAIAQHWRDAGASEVAAKTGAGGCVLAYEESAPQIVSCTPVSVRDSSGAGDAFNAGYLGARLSSLSPGQAARAGHDLAAWVVQRPGALPAPDDLAPYVALMHRKSHG